VRKIWLSLLVLVSIGVYFWMGDEDSTDSRTQPPVAASDEGRPSAVIRGPAARKLAPSQQPRSWTQQSPYQQASPQPYGGSSFGLYPVPEAYTPPPAPTQGYRFRPLTRSEKAKLEQGSAAAPQMAPAEPAYIGRPAFGGAPSSGYPTSGYAASEYPQVGLPGSVSPATADMQPTPTPTYKFRQFDPERASKRWTGNYSMPSQPTPPAFPDRSSPYAPRWSPPSSPRYQRGPFPDQDPLWAAQDLNPLR